MSRSVSFSGRAGARSACPASLRALAMLACLLAAACSRTTAPAGKAAGSTSAKVKAVAPASRSVDVYYPLTPRSRWTYRIHDFGRKWTYKNVVQVFGQRFVEEIGKGGISVEERYSSNTGPFFVEEQEPILYFRENGYLNRIFLTYQGRKLVAASGSGDTAFLPETLEPGKEWTSDSTAFQMGNSGGLGVRVSHKHVVQKEPETVAVPAGEFEDCIRVDTFSSQGPNSGRLPGEEIVFYYSDWYAPGVGLVKTEQWRDATRTTERARIELLEYSVLPPGAAEPAAENKPAEKPADKAASDTGRAGARAPAPAKPAAKKK